METTKFTKQMIDFQKTLFENSYNAITVIQNHSEKLMFGYLKQFPWVTEETKKPFEDSLSFIKEAREEYKRNVDQGFNNLEDLICSKQGKPGEKEKEKTTGNVSKGAADSSQLAPVPPKTKQAARG